MAIGMVYNFETGKWVEQPAESKVEPGAEFTVKVSRSLGGSHEAISILIYNEDRSFIEEFTDNGKDIARVVECLGRLQARPKAYFNAQMNETGIKLLEEVDNPGW